MVYIKGRFNPGEFLGKYVRLFLIPGGIFNLRLHSLVDEHITGIDDEGNQITLALELIDFIVDLEGDPEK